MATPRKALALAAVLATAANAALDLSAGNRRAAIDGLPDWSKAGYGSGKATALPDASQVGFTLTADDLKTQYGVIADDDKDDTDGLYAAITAMKLQGRRSGSFALIQLPPGKLLLTKTLPLDVSYIILRGAGSDPNNGGTTLEFKPDENTRYDTLTANGARWDMEATGYDYTYMEDDNQGGQRERSGSASGGWLWPGRPMLLVGSTAVAPKYTIPHQDARPNRKDLFLGSVNFHFRNDTRVKGFMADQTKDIAGKLGEDKVYVDAQNTSWPWATGQDVWIGSPVRSVDYESWDVQNASYILNAYMYQDWFTVKSAGTDAEGSFITLDRPLRFNVYSTSESGGAALMENATVPAKIMPIEDPIHHVGIENLYITQPMDNLDATKAVNNYGNLAPASAMHGILFKFARDSWVSGVHTYMTGSHPIATENARWLTIQNNYFDGSWNKGAGGNGYMRGSRVWDSVYYNNTLRNLRHFTFQWAAMGNVAVENDMDCDMNLHGGGEGFNLFERNTVRIAYDHRSGSCDTNCGGEGGTEDEGTWGPIYWSAGDKASKWSGATGPQNVFFGNVMQKAWNVSEPIADYEPYYKTDGSLSNTIFEFGWSGSAFEHLSLDGETPVLDWMHNERAEWKAGLVKSKTDSAKSLFVKDVEKQAAGGGSSTSGSDAASHMAGFSSVAIFAALSLLFLA